MRGAAGDTTPTDPRSQRNRASRRGGQLLTRARSSCSASACPHLRAPGASVPDGRTIRRNQSDRSRDKRRRHLHTGYFHNASVPTLYDLLLPPEQRPKKSALGGSEYDLVRSSALWSAQPATSRTVSSTPRGPATEMVATAGVRTCPSPIAWSFWNASRPTDTTDASDVGRDPERFRKSAVELSFVSRPPGNRDRVIRETSQTLRVNRGLRCLAARVPARRVPSCRLNNRR